MPHDHDTATTRCTRDGAADAARAITDAGKIVASGHAAPSPTVRGGTKLRRVHGAEARPQLARQPASQGRTLGLEAKLLESRTVARVRASTTGAMLDRLAHPPHARMPARISLLRSDPELIEAVPAADRPRAHRALWAAMLTFAPGLIDLAIERLSETTFALLLVKGTLTQEADLSDRAMIELLLDGDVVLPWPPSPTAPETKMRLTALDEVRLAVLDHHFLQAAALWPGLIISVQRRLNDQKHRLATHGAICQLPRVEQRVMAIMWHLAARTGIVGCEGTLLPRPLTHEALAHLTGSRRPTVSLAVKTLRESGYLDRRADGAWLLPRRAGTSSFEDLIANLSEV